MHRLIEVSGPFGLGDLPSLPLQELFGRYRRRYRSEDARLDEGEAPLRLAWILHLGRLCQSEDVHETAGRYGFRPPHPRHVAAFGLRFPHVPDLFPIAGVPSDEEAKRTGRACCLGAHGSLTLVRLTEHHTGWSKECRFLLIG